MLARIQIVAVLMVAVLPPAAAALAANNAVPALRDMGPAVPVRDIGKLPSTSQQYRDLQLQLHKGHSAVGEARRKSDALKAQAARLKRKLIDTAARVQFLESEKIRLDADIVRLTAQERVLSASFAHDRVGVTHLLAILERLQTDMPPAMALKPNDALGAARGAMLIGASLPNVYDAAAALARRLDALRQTRADLVSRRAQGVRNTAQLAIARVELNQLVAMKELEAEAAESRYGDLQAKLDAVAEQASNLESLLSKVAALRAENAPRGVVVVTAQNGQIDGTLRGRKMLRPVIGPVAGSGDQAGFGPGLTFISAASAQVVAPADSNVLFAGRYHKSGQVLILEMTGGYDLVLEGLDRVDVRPGDQLLAGEPVGTMPQDASASRLYFEIRKDGRAMSPVPWMAGDIRKKT